MNTSIFSVMLLEALLNAHLTSYADLITFLKGRSGHDWRYGINATKMKDELSWQLDETLKQESVKQLGTK